jgi:hypothetical protein
MPKCGHKRINPGHRWFQHANQMCQFVLRLAPETGIFDDLSRQRTIDKNGLAILTGDAPRLVIQRFDSSGRHGRLQEKREFYQSVKLDAMSRELIESWTDYASAAERLLTMAKHRLQIYDEDLQALKLDTVGHLASLSTLLTGHGDHPLSIALRDASYFQMHSPRLQRLLITWEHKAEVRQAPTSLAHLRDNMLLVDNSHALVRLEKNLPRSVLIIDEPEAVAAYAKRFSEIWQESNINLLKKPLGL